MGTAEAQGGPSGRDRKPAAAPPRSPVDGRGDRDAHRSPNRSGSVVTEEVATRWDWDHGVTLFEPTSARPYYRITYRTVSGKRRQPSGGTDFNTAFAKAQLIEDGLAAAVGDDDGRTVNQMTDAWLEELTPDWSPRHAFDQGHHVKTWVTPTIGHLAASTLTRDDVKALLDVPTSTSGRRHLRAAVGGLLRWGYDEGWLALSHDALLPRKPRTAKRDAGRAHGESRLFIADRLRPSASACRSLADAMRAVGAKQGQQYWLMVAIAASCGVREGELFALRPSDVDLVHGSLAVRRQLIRVTDQPPQETPPKWGKIRTTVLPELTIWGEPLREPLRQFMADKPPHGLLFPAARGGWIHASNFTARVLKPARAAAADWQPGWVWHSLRHSFASHLLASWEEERDEEGNITRARKVAAMDVDVADACGHRDSGVTRSMYVGATEGTMDRLNRILA